VPATERDDETNHCRARLLVDHPLKHVGFYTLLIHFAVAFT